MIFKAERYESTSFSGIVDDKLHRINLALVSLNENHDTFNCFTLLSPQERGDKEDMEGDNEGDSQSCDNCIDLQCKCECSE